MKKLYLFAFFLVIYEFTTYVANDMIMPGMLNVVNEFHAPLNYVSLSLTLYIFGNCCLQLFLGPLSLRFGQRNIILVGNILFFCVTIFIMFANNIQSFMLGRLLQGSGVGFIAMGYTLIHEKCDDKAAVKIFALMANISMLAPLLGPLIGVIVLINAGWRYIFAVIGLLAIIAFAGLFKFTPIIESKAHNLNLIKILKSYGQIMRTRQFILGVLASSFAVLPGMCWIGLAPTIIMKTCGLSMMTYAIYQLIAIGGLTLSSFLMQLVAGRFSFYRLMTTMSLIAFGGLTMGIIFHNNLNIVTSGMFLYTFGLGIFNNLIMRLVITIPDLPQSMVTSLMVFIQTLIFTIGIEIVTRVCQLFHYSLFCFTMISFVLACLFVILVNIYAYQNKTKQWN